MQVKNGTISAIPSFDEPTVLLLACKDQKALFLINCGVNDFTWDINKPSSFSIWNNGVNADFAVLLQRLDELDNQIIELSKVVRALENNKQAQDSVLALKDQVQRTYPLVTRTFIQEHPNSFTSLYLLHSSLSSTPIDLVKAAYARLGKGLKHFPSAKAVKEYINHEKKQLLLSQLTPAVRTPLQGLPIMLLISGVVGASLALRQFRLSRNSTSSTGRKTSSL